MPDTPDVLESDFNDSMIGSFLEKNQFVMKADGVGLLCVCLNHFWSGYRTISLDPSSGLIGRNCVSIMLFWLFISSGISVVSVTHDYKRP